MVRLKDGEKKMHHWFGCYFTRILIAAQALGAADGWDIL
jgi:hypothetical protein